MSICEFFLTYERIRSYEGNVDVSTMKTLLALHSIFIQIGVVEVHYGDEVSMCVRECTYVCAAVSDSRLLKLQFRNVVEMVYNIEYIHIRRCLLYANFLEEIETSK